MKVYIHEIGFYTTSNGLKLLLRTEYRYVFYGSLCNLEIKNTQAKPFEGTSFCVARKTNGALIVLYD
jgi:hypothetical protein